MIAIMITLDCIMIRLDEFVVVIVRHIVVGSCSCTLHSYTNNLIPN